jgi:hypothetical protein
MKSSIDWSAADFRKSTRSQTQNTNNCVEVAFANTVVGVKDSKNPAAFAVVEFDTDVWKRFLAATAG